MTPINHSVKHSRASLYFIVDPLCGWTYAAQPIFKQALTIKNINIEVLSGGMLAFDQRRTINKDWQQFVTPMDRRIHEVSGMPFGKGYQQSLTNVGHILDSEPPSKAMLVAQQMEKSSLARLAAIQKAYFVDGLDISDGMVLSRLATLIGLEPYTFLNKYQQLGNERIEEHFNKAADLLSSVHGKGYPSAILEIEGQRELLNLNRFYSNPNHWKSALIDKISSPMAIA